LNGQGAVRVLAAASTKVICLHEADLAQLSGDPELTFDEIAAIGSRSRLANQPQTGTGSQLGMLKRSAGTLNLAHVLNYCPHLLGALLYIERGGTMQKLPARLEREPLVDALFEVRVSPSSPLADIIPGFLMHDLGGDARMTRLPAADLPFPVRKQDPNLQNAPLLRIEWGNYFISVGDRNVVISCKMPYPKWPSFKAAILDFLARIAKLDPEGPVERYSLKYVNLIPATDYANQIGKVRMDVTLGDLHVSEQHISLQVHEKTTDAIHIYNIVTGAQVRTNEGKQTSGILVDIDSIRNLSAPSLRDLSSSIEEGLEALRQENKSKFFSCLTKPTIEEMGPVL